MSDLFVLQPPRPIKLEHKTTRETGLCYWGKTRFCVMESTGDIVFFGKENEDHDAALHIYSFKNGWNNVAKMSTPCCRQVLYILPVIIENNERLLVSCWQCSTVWFCDIENGNFSQAIERKGYYPGPMCKAEGDYVYIVNLIKGPRTILKAKCTPTELIVDKIKTIHSKMEHIVFMEYLPDTNCIVLSRWKDNLVKVVLFDDTLTATSILDCETAVGCKQLGKHVKGYNRDTWLKCDVKRDV